jgi:hypothetical protein
VTKQPIYKKRLKVPCCLAFVDAPKHSYWEKEGLVAMGSFSEVIIATLVNIRELDKIKRPIKLVSPTALPFLAFGTGFTPNNNSRPEILLLVAWDTLIQVFIFDESNTYVEKDGFYIC